MGIIGNLAKNKQTNGGVSPYIRFNRLSLPCSIAKRPKTSLSLSLSLRVTTMASDGVPPIIAAQLNYLLSHFPLSVKVTLFIFPFHFLGNQTELKKKKKKKLRSYKFILFLCRLNICGPVASSPLESLTASQ